MPLDPGSAAPDTFAAVEANDNPVTAPPRTHSTEALVFSYGAHLGEGLRAAREARELSLQDVSDATKIHPKILDALEALDMGRLPSRPFAIGFVRSYAQFLGVDAERAIARFKADAPDSNEPFRAPVGVPDDRDPRLGLIAVGAALVLGAIVVWNVAQRAMADKEPDVPPVVAAPPPVAAIPKGPVALGDALPAPVESTVPKPYVTPGLGESTNSTGDPTRPLQIGATLPELKPSNPNPKVYGAPAEQASVISLRARKSVALIVKTADGSAIFTHVLGAGETYRAPAVSGLSFDVSDPSGVDVFRSGEFIGQLPALITPASRLGGDAKPAPPTVKVAPAPAAAAPAASTTTPAPAPKAVAPTPKAAAPVAAKPPETKSPN